MAEIKIRIPTVDCLFLCDRRACKVCRPECKHTIDITHAKSFENKNGVYVQNENI